MQIVGDTAVDNIKIKTMSIKIKAQSICIYIYVCISLLGPCSSTDALTFGPMYVLSRYLDPLNRSSWPEKNVAYSCFSLGFTRIHVSEVQKLANTP